MKHGDNYENLDRRFFSRFSVLMKRRPWLPTSLFLFLLILPLLFTWGGIGLRVRENRRENNMMDFHLSSTRFLSVELHAAFISRCLTVLESTAFYPHSHAFSIITFSILTNKQRTKQRERVWRRRRRRTKEKKKAANKDSEDTGQNGRNRENNEEMEQRILTRNSERLIWLEQKRKTGRNQSTNQ